MGGEIVGNLLFQPRINVRVIVAIRDHTTRTIERDIRDATACGITTLRTMTALEVATTS